MHVQAFIDALPLMGKGMLGVFAVIAILYAAIVLLRQFGSKKQDSDEQ
ncbi:hypothetical protein LJC27_00650 [Christensenellaceae bacterium OttesenSCG-928-M15]|nr:hypothetical protein [Christensenellaceae bacterium OttesenSCG-928-M15]